MTAEIEGNGKGTILSLPTGIECGDKCLESFTEGTEVTLTANPEQGYAFTRWGGACSDATQFCVVTMAEARNVSAVFEVGITEVISEVSIDNAVGFFVGTPFPEGSGAPPALQGSAQLVRGGSLILNVTVADNADELLVGLDDSARKGYFVINLRDLEATDLATSTYQLNVSAAYGDRYDGFELLVATRGAAGISAASAHTVSVNDQAQTSTELQFSLNWMNSVDLDLHIETPEGVDINYTNPVGPSGGVLDLDSNSGCGIDGVRNENVTWINGQQPTFGRYIVRADLWSACNQSGPLSYAMTAHVCGTIQTWNGTYEPEEESYGNLDWDRIVAEIEYSDTIDSVEFWINAFTPRNIPVNPSASASAYTIDLPSNKTAIPGLSKSAATNGTCFHTDQRGFSSEIGTDVRMQSIAEVDFSTTPPTVSQAHRTGVSTAVLCDSGNEIATQPVSDDNLTLEVVELDNATDAFALRAVGSMDPGDLAGDSQARWDVNVVVDRQDGRITLDGEVGAFPAYEAYVSINHGRPQKLFTQFIDSQDPWSLRDGTRVRVQGEVQYACQR